MKHLPFALCLIAALWASANSFYYKAESKLWQSNYALLSEQYNSIPKPISWSKGGHTHDGCMVEYSWKEFEGDTCCLDSVVYDAYGYKNYSTKFVRDSSGRIDHVIVHELDSL